jgi:SAM-dependent methyltransferase
MVGERPARILDLGSGTGSFASMLVDAGHEVFGLDRDQARVARLGERLGTGLHVVAQVEALPFLACHFDVVTASQTLHHFAPGLALSEIARVLKPGGHLAVAYNTRDDTVPWVKRLIGLMQQVDPASGAGDYGVEAVEAVLDSPYFTGVERRSFRNWVPISRAGLVAMAERRPATQRLDPEHRARLLDEVAALYDASARPPEPLLLPFRATCWRAVADHSQLAVVDDDFDALEIRI